ncbi:MAG: excinuclease ABC subunit UvrA [Deltaproteobacteria bacterium]
MKDQIIIKGARQHNLKNLDLTLPRNQLIIFTGVSGSGKSSLAFDTIYAEGQRRYVESLSTYARQFLGQMDKPDVDYIEGLSPSISIDQKATSNNPRSTVGTVTEVYDYLRLLFARVGHPHCPRCGRPIERQTVDQIVDQVLSMEEGTKIKVLAPVIKGKKGEHAKLMAGLFRDGFSRLLVDDNEYTADEEITLDKNLKHDISVVVDRLVIKDTIRGRLAEAIEMAFELAQGVAQIQVLGDGEELRVYSRDFACVECGFSLPELSPRLFSFNNPYGACTACGGLGFKMEIDSSLVLDGGKSLDEGAVRPWASNWMGYYQTIMQAFCQHHHIPMDKPVTKLTSRQRELILHGNGEERLPIVYQNQDGDTRHFNAHYEGIVNNLYRRYGETSSDMIRDDIEKYMTQIPCSACGGKRLKPEVLAVTVGDLAIDQVTGMSVRAALEFFKELQLSEKEQLIARQVIKEINARLGFLSDVGLDYLTLDRAAGTLSGGEAQRIRLATQVGSSLVGVLYVLDEPSIGLHPRDNNRLINTLTRLRDLGNTVIVVEHDEETIRTGDYIVDIGPGAGVNGGQVIAQGTLTDIIKKPGSLTGQYLSGVRRIDVPAERRSGNGSAIVIRGAKENNLKGINVNIPLGTFTCVTGVSGSGKSTLVEDILYKALSQHYYGSKERPGHHKDIQGLDLLDKVINIDQSPIGRTPRSNPATYTGAFDSIRELFSNTPEARIRGYKPGRFSFNVRGGRCESCAGDGIIKIEMHFLPDVYVPCEVCKGKRYNRETLEVKYKGKNISEVLAMTVEEAAEFFEPHPKIYRKLKVLQDVGLGYITLGQPAPTLSGGEAQRVKLATELSKRSTGRTFYILDEPTTGLHMEDIRHLLGVLQRLVDAGNTVLVIEHNLDVIKCADHVIDLGPEGGEEGGFVVAAGTPEKVAATRKSYTGRFLAPLLHSQK